MDDESKDSQQTEQSQPGAEAEDRPDDGPTDDVTEGAIPADDDASVAVGSADEPDTDGPVVGEADGADAPVDGSPCAEAGEQSEAGDGAEEPEDELAELQAQAKRTHDRLLRTAADFENYRRRSRRDAQSAVALAEEKIAARFLPIVDNLERAIAHGEENGEVDDSQSLLDGVKMVHRQFLVALAECQIEPFESAGEIFDPELHEAIQQAESDVPRNTVTLEVQRGYRRGERLVRPAMVVVSSGPAGASETEDVDSAGSGDDGGLDEEAAPRD